MMVEYRYSRGFTIVELLVVIVVIGVLSGLTFTYAQSTQVKAKDIERSSDVNSLARHFEQRYRVFAGTSGPTYPSTSDVSGLLLEVTLAGADVEISYAPKQTSSSIVTASGRGPQTPKINEYIYQPFSSDGTLCGSAPCVRFILYYRQEVDGTIKTVESIRQQ